MSSLRSDVLQTYLPDELVHAILIRMCYRDKDYKPVKRGLASCSLTCRHWAKPIRQMLFERLAIRSAEDIEQLLTFLDNPEILDRALRDCIRELDVTDDQTSSSIPWSHQILRLRHRISSLRDVSLTIKTSGADDELHPRRDSSRPFTIIPRTLPGSIMPLARLTLSNLQLPSVKALSNYIQHLYTPYIELNAMTFVKEDVQDIQRRMPHSYSELSNVTVSRYSQDIAGFLRWFNITNMLYACQGCLWVDDAHLALAEKYMSIILSHFPHRDRARRLETRFDRMYPQGWKYRCSTYDSETSWRLASVSVRLPDASSTHPHIRPLSMIYDRAIDDFPDLLQQWASFESALMDAGGISIPQVKIGISSKGTGKEVLALLLSGRILARLHGHLGKIQLGVYDQAIKLSLLITPDDIFASAHVTLDGETIELDAAERAEWLLSKSEEWNDDDGRRQAWDKREEYVREMLRPARAAAATAGASADTSPSAADDARGTAPEYIQETTDEEEASDEGDAGVDEAAG